jgi:hypothetical protein
LITSAVKLKRLRKRNSFDNKCRKLKRKRKRKNYAGSKTTPNLNKEKEPLWYRVPESSSTAKKRRKTNGDQEGCRLGLKPAPDER